MLTNVISPEAQANAVFGYFVSKFVEWLKTSDHFTFINPDTTKLTQALVAVCNFLFAALWLWASGGHFAWDMVTLKTVVWPAVLGWIVSELNYHLTLKEYHEDALDMGLGVMSFTSDPEDK